VKLVDTIDSKSILRVYRFKSDNRYKKDEIGKRLSHWAHDPKIVGSSPTFVTVFIRAVKE
jgi:hypothetical protein